MTIAEKRSVRIPAPADKCHANIRGLAWRAENSREGAGTVAACFYFALTLQNARLRGVLHVPSRTLGAAVDDFSPLQVPRALETAPSDQQSSHAPLSMLRTQNRCLCKVLAPRAADIGGGGGRRDCGGQQQGKQHGILHSCFAWDRYSLQRSGSALFRVQREYAARCTTADIVLRASANNQRAYSPFIYGAKPVCRDGVSNRQTDNPEIIMSVTNDYQQQRHSTAHDGPAFSGLDLFAGIVVVIMILGPLTAGATHASNMGWSTQQTTRDR